MATHNVNTDDAKPRRRSFGAVLPIDQRNRGRPAYETQDTGCLNFLFSTDLPALSRVADFSPSRAVSYFLAGYLRVSFKMYPLSRPRSSRHPSSGYRGKLPSVLAFRCTVLCEN